MPDPTRPHDVSELTVGELERAGRDLRASLALVRPDSPVCVPILARLSAIDTELAVRVASQGTGASRRDPGIYLCSCGFGTDDREWLRDHLFEHPGHCERQPAGTMDC